MKKGFLCLSVMLFIVLSGCSLKENNSNSKNDQVSSPQNSANVGNNGVLPKRTIGGYPWTYFPTFQLFLGKSDEECDAKLTAMFNHYFYGPDNQKIYFTNNANEAFIFDDVHTDVRTEGMSYGMMICVQLNKQTEFDRLWRWAKNHMKQSATGLFAWQCNSNGTVMDNKSASDGEEYFAMALLFASNRWGNSGAFNYQQDAANLLNAMITQNMFPNNIVGFQPGNNWTDSSYIVPAFYQLYSIFGPSTLSNTWKTIETTSRALLKTIISKHSSIGLVSKLSEQNGNDRGSDGFEYDCWRTIQNVVIDNFFTTNSFDEYGAYPGSTYCFVCGYADALISFLKTKSSIFSNGQSDYPDLYSLTGTASGTNHRLGFVAMNGVAARACPSWGNTVNVAQELWNVQLNATNDKYYQGCLYMLAMLFSTGAYRIWQPGNIPWSINMDPVIKSCWSGKVLTATGTQNNADIKGQPRNTSWSSQDWYIEHVDGNDNVRLKNIWSGRYLMVQNQYENAKIICYDLVSDWLSEQWAIEQANDGSGSVRFRNAWSGKYLTVENTSDYANMWAQTLNPSWTSQKWIIMEE